MSKPRTFRQNIGYLLIGVLFWLTPAQTSAADHIPDRASDRTNDEYIQEPTLIPFLYSIEKRVNASPAVEQGCCGEVIPAPSCPRVLEYKQVRDSWRGLYELKRGDTIDHLCSKDLKAPSQLRKAVDLENYLRDRLVLTEGGAFPPLDRSCLKGKWSVKPISSALTAEYYYVLARLRQGSLLALEETAALNTVLGESDARAGLSCDVDEIPDYRQWCRNMRMCGSEKKSAPFCFHRNFLEFGGKKRCVTPGPGFDELIPETEMAYKALKVAEEEAKPLRDKLGGLETLEQLRCREAGVCTALENIPEWKSANDRLQPLTDTIAALKMIYPWIDGPKFKANYSGRDKESLREAIYEQLLQSRDDKYDLLKSYRRAARCIHEQSLDCGDFEKAVRKAPSRVRVPYRPDEKNGEGNGTGSDVAAAADSRAAANAALDAAECRWKERVGQGHFNGYVENMLLGLALGTVTGFASTLGAGAEVGMFANIVGAAVAAGQVSSVCKEAFHGQELPDTWTRFNANRCVAVDRIADSRVTSNPKPCLMAALFATPAFVPFALPTVQKYLMVAETTAGAAASGTRSAMTNNLLANLPGPGWSIFKLLNATPEMFTQPLFSITGQLVRPSAAEIARAKRVAQELRDSKTYEGKVFSWVKVDRDVLKKYYRPDAEVTLETLAAATIGESAPPAVAGNAENRVLFQIHSQHARDLTPLSDQLAGVKGINSLSVVFLPGSRFRVRSVDRSSAYGGGTTVVTLEEIDAKTSPSSRVTSAPVSDTRP